MEWGRPRKLENKWKVETQVWGPCLKYWRQRRGCWRDMSHCLEPSRGFGDVRTTRKTKNQGCEWKMDVLAPHPNSKCCLSDTSKQSIYTRAQRLGDAGSRPESEFWGHGSTSAALPGTTWPRLASTPAANMQLCPALLYSAVTLNLKAGAAQAPAAAPGWRWTHDHQLTKITAHLYPFVTLAGLQETSLNKGRWQSKAGSIQGASWSPGFDAFKSTFLSSTPPSHPFLVHDPHWKHHWENMSSSGTGF